MTTSAAPILADDRHRQVLRGREGARRRRLPPAARRGPRAAGRERRRQVDADQGADRRVRRSTPARSSSRGEPRALRAARSRRSAPASAPSTRRSTSARTSRWRRTSTSAASRAASGASSGARCAAAPPRRSRASTSTSTSRRSLSTHSLAVQQMVAIARAIDISAEVLILDEPTSSLDRGEVEQLFARDPAARRREGIAVVFVSHFLDQVYEIADRMTVLRNGRLVGEWPTAELPPGRARLEDARPGARDARGARAEAARGRWTRSRRRRRCSRPRRSAARGAIAPFDLALHRGEVVGLAGLLGSGRTEVARLLFGADRADSGRAHVDGAAGRDPQPARRRPRTASRSAPRTAGPRGSSRS